MIVDLFVLCAFVVITLGIFIASDVVLSFWFDEQMRRKGQQDRRALRALRAGNGERRPGPSQRAASAHPNSERGR